MGQELPINQIICGDCVAVMSGLPDDCIDLTVTSPPYDKLRDYHGYTFDFPAIAAQLYRITKPGGVVVWVVADQTKNGCESLTSFKQAIHFVEIAGFNLLDTMIYRRPTPYPHKRQYRQEFEFMFVLTKGKGTTFNSINDYHSKYAGEKQFMTKRKPDGTLSEGFYFIRPEGSQRGNVWNYNSGYMHATKDKIAYEHPAIFPESLAADHIRSWSNEGETILDPMCGSGTTCKMAKALQRNYIGIDVSAKYCDLARQRVSGEVSAPVYQPATAESKPPLKIQIQIGF